MPKLIPIQLENGLTLYMETQENEVMPIPSNQQEKTVSTTIRSGNMRSSGLNTAGLKTAIQNFEMIENTISSFTNYALNAFKRVSGANVDKVTLEFGITIGAEGGIPYITKGSAEGNLKVTITCSLPNKNAEPDKKENDNE